MSYSYNTLHQLTEESWTEECIDQKSNARVAEPRDEYYYGYDRIASVINIYDANGQVITGGIFEQDAYGQAEPAPMLAFTTSEGVSVIYGEFFLSNDDVWRKMNTSWLDDFTRHFGGHTWEADEGFYHSEPSDPSNGTSTSSGHGTGRPQGLDDSDVTTSSTCGIAAGGGLDDIGSKCEAYADICKNIFVGEAGAVTMCRSCQTECTDSDASVPPAEVFSECVRESQKGYKLIRLFLKIYRKFMKKGTGCAGL